MAGAPVGILELWLPILLSTLACFFGGAILYMVSPLHKNDWVGVSDEDGVMAALRKAGVQAGHYMFPWCADSKTRTSPEYLKKWADGPTGIMVVRPRGPTNMGPMLLQMLLYHLLVSSLLACLAAGVFGSGTAYIVIFKFVALIGVMTYGLGLVPMSIWYGFQWGFTFRGFLDGMIHGLLTAGIFGWLWPR